MKFKSLNLHNFGTEVKAWFHPATALLQDGRIFATMQEINGSDHYGPPMFAVSEALEGTWTAPMEIPAFKSMLLPGTPFTEGIADVRPFTLQDGRVAAFGCTVYYTEKGNACWDKSVKDTPPPGRAVYSIWSPDTGMWSKRHILELAGVTRTYRTACTQVVLLENDRILLPFYLDSGKACDFYEHEFPRFASKTAIYRIQGELLTLDAQSELLELPVLRGCIEPSAIRLADGTFALTMRAEDGNMYRAVSADGLAWRDMRPWRWDDGTQIETASTQQHWLCLGDKAYLVYTRNNGANVEIMRFRAPLYIAEADVARACLVRASEKVLFPQSKVDGVSALYGDFHCSPFGENAAVVTDSALYSSENRIHTDVMSCLVEGTYGAPGRVQHGKDIPELPGQ